MKKMAFPLALLILVMGGALVSTQAQERYTLFEAIHYGHDIGNWNVGLWRHYGDGIQIPYRITTPCGTQYPGGPINRGGSGRVYWGAYGVETHSFTMTYDPDTRQLSFTVEGQNFDDPSPPTTITEEAESPRIDAQCFCDPPDTVCLFLGGEVGKVNTLHMVIHATAGTTVSTCGPSNWGCKNQEVRSSQTEVANLYLDGLGVAGFMVSADLSEDPTAPSFTHALEVDIPVPDDQAWELTGDIIVTFDTDDLNFSPKQWRVGLQAYGEYVTAAPTTTTTTTVPATTTTVPTTTTFVPTTTTTILPTTTTTTTTTTTVPTTTMTTSTTTTTLPPNDHYKCYRTTQVGSPRFAQRAVTLEDQFGTTNTTVERPRRFCNPVDKGGEGIDDPTAHLMCYDVREQRFERQAVVVENQFGKQTLTIIRPYDLCVPAEKDGVPSELNINHFKCYKVSQGSPKFAEREVDLSDQFETRATRVRRPRLLCNPVDKEGEGVPDPENHLVCYMIKDASGQPKFQGIQVDVADQFGKQDLSTLRGDCRKASYLCVPSTKRLASPSGAFLDVQGSPLD